MREKEIVNLGGIHVIVREDKQIRLCCGFVDFLLTPARVNQFIAALYEALNFTFAPRTMIRSHVLPGTYFRWEQHDPKVYMAVNQDGLRFRSVDREGTLFTQNNPDLFCHICKNWEGEILEP